MNTDPQQMLIITMGGTLLLVAITMALSTPTVWVLKRLQAVKLGRFQTAFLLAEGVAVTIMFLVFLSMVLALKGG